MWAPLLQVAQEDPVGLARGATDYVKEAGLIGVAVAFILAQYFGILAWGKDVKKAEKRATEAEDKLADEQVRNGQLTVTVKQLSEVLQQATGGFERVVAHRIAREEEVDVNDVLEAMALGPGYRRSPRAIRHPYPPADSGPSSGRSPEDRAAS